MAQLDKVKDKPKGKPVKNKNWKDLKDFLKLNYDGIKVGEAFGLSKSKYTTDIELADALRRFLNVN